MANSLKINNLTAIVIAKNEQQKLAECLRSLSFAGEIILFDNDSTDKTALIAKKYAHKIFKLPEGDFSERKNLAFAKIKNEWILSLDADERITPELSQEIAFTLHETPDKYAAFAIPRKNYILGKEFKHSNQWPDYVIRLFKRSKFVKWSGKLHEQPLIDGELGYLVNPLLHIKHDNISDMVEKTNDWSLIEAELMYEAGHPKMNFPRFCSAMGREFFLRMIRQKAYMDGNQGIIYALYQVFSKFLSYAKLWELQLNDEKKTDI